MGLFDRLGGSREVILNSKSAILLACITMVAADGDIDDDELAIIRRIDGAGNTAAWDAAVAVFKKHSLGDCADYACKFVDKSHVLPLMANLIDIAMADGQLMGAEKALLERYMEELNPDQGVVSEIVGVIKLKNSVTTI